MSVPTSVMPGVIGGALIAFTLSFDEFVQSFLVARGGAQTLPSVIFARIRFMLSSVFNATVVVILISVGPLLASQLASCRRERPV